MHKGNLTFAEDLSDSQTKGLEAREYGDCEILSEHGSPVFIYIYRAFGLSPYWFWAQPSEGNALLFKSLRWRVGAD